MLLVLHAHLHFSFEYSLAFSYQICLLTVLVIFLKSSRAGKSNVQGSSQFTDTIAFLFEKPIASSKIHKIPFDVWVFFLKAQLKSSFFCSFLPAMSLLQRLQHPSSLILQAVILL